MVEVKSVTMKKPCQLVFNAIQLIFLFYTNFKGLFG